MQLSQPVYLNVRHAQVLHASRRSKRLDLKWVAHLTTGVTTGSRYARTDRADGTRDAILTAAEKLFAECGIATVSNRQIVQAANQGNNAAVVYHFGNRADLVLAIEQEHARHIEKLRQQRIAHTSESAGLQDWVACLVEPFTSHLASLGKPSYYARFIAQAATDPLYQSIVTKSALESPSLRQLVDNINDRLPQLPAHVRTERNLMTRMMLHHTCAVYESDMAEGRKGRRPSWRQVGRGLIDAIAAVWQAPVT